MKMADYAHGTFICFKPKLPSTCMSCRKLVMPGMESEEMFGSMDWSDNSSAMKALSDFESLQYLDISYLPVVS